MTKLDAITITKLKKSFGQQTVLRGVDLTVKTGEIFTLLGENGAGKTTLINILATLAQPDSGQVRIFGQSIFARPEAIRHLISLNAQTNTLDDEFSGYDNLLLIAQLRNLEQPKQTIANLAQRLNLTSFIKRKVSTYSGGMRRRLDIAMSLLGDPELIFLDEPTTGVDPRNRLEIWQLIQELRDAGKTIFLNTQSLEEASYLSDHIGFLDQGRIVLYGTPAQVTKNAQQNYQIKLETSDVALAVSLLTDEQIDCSEQNGVILVASRSAQTALDLLTGHGLKILNFQEIQTDLETIFLNVTNKQVSK